MRQIKTIYKIMDPKIMSGIEIGDFDRQVNEALQEGWRLIKREVFHPDGSTDYDYHRTLYAELERDVATADDRGCGNCRYANTPCSCEPCVYCTNKDGLRDFHLWEARE